MVQILSHNPSPLLPLPKLFLHQSSVKLQIASHLLKFVLLHVCPLVVAMRMGVAWKGKKKTIRVVSASLSQYKS